MRSSGLVLLQHPAQQVQLLADAMDPHLGTLRVAVKVRALVGHEGAARRRALLQFLASHAEVEAVGTLAPVFGGTEPALAVLRLREITVDLSWGGRIAALQREGVVDQGMLSFHRRLLFSAASSSSSSSPRRSRRLSNRALGPAIHFVTWSMAPGRRRQCRVRPCLYECTKPLVSRIRRCWVTAVKVMSMGSASPLSVAGPLAKRSTMARRPGAAKAWKRSSI